MYYKKQAFKPVFFGVNCFIVNVLKELKITEFLDVCLISSFTINESKFKY